MMHNFSISLTGTDLVNCTMGQENHSEMVSKIIGDNKVGNIMKCHYLNCFCTLLIMKIIIFLIVILILVFIQPGPQFSILRSKDKVNERKPLQGKRWKCKQVKICVVFFLTIFIAKISDFFFFFFLHSTKLKSMSLNLDSILIQFREVINVSLHSRCSARTRVRHTKEQKCTTESMLSSFFLHDFLLACAGWMPVLWLMLTKSPNIWAGLWIRPDTCWSYAGYSVVIEDFTCTLAYSGTYL